MVWRRCCNRHATPVTGDQGSAGPWLFRRLDAGSGCTVTLPVTSGTGAAARIFTPVEHFGDGQRMAAPKYKNGRQQFATVSFGNAAESIASSFPGPTNGMAPGALGSGRESVHSTAPSSHMSRRTRPQCRHRKVLLLRAPRASGGDGSSCADMQSRPGLRTAHGTATSFEMRRRCPQPPPWASCRRDGQCHLFEHGRCSGAGTRSKSSFRFRNQTGDDAAACLRTRAWRRGLVGRRHRSRTTWVVVASGSGGPNSGKRSPVRDTGGPRRMRDIITSVHTRNQHWMATFCKLVWSRTPCRALTMPAACTSSEIQTAPGCGDNLATTAATDLSLELYFAPCHFVAPRKKMPGISACVSVDLSVGVCWWFLPRWHHHHVGTR